MEGELWGIANLINLKLDDVKYKNVLGDKLGL